MLLYFHVKAQELRLTVLEMFETAYVAILKKQGNVIPDYCDYIQHHMYPWYDLPVYMKTWLKQLQEYENANRRMYGVQEDCANQLQSELFQATDEEARHDASALLAKRSAQLS